MSSSDEEELAQFAGYKTLKRLGQGSFGEVFKVKDLNDGETKVIKASHTKHDARYDPRTLKSFETEVKLLKKCNHPGVVQCHQARIDSDTGRIIIVLEYANNKSLRTFLNKNHSQLDKKLIISYLKQLTQGLHHIHSLKILHRDLKPDNILLTKDGKAKITDFGVSKESVISNLSIKTTTGTPLYMAPEVLLRKKYDAKCDIFSLGLIAYELCERVLPFGYNLAKLKS